MKKQKKPMSLKTKDRLLTLTSILTVITPLLVTVGINFNDYFMQRAGGVSVGFGGALALILVVLLSKNKLTVFHGVWGYLIVFLLAVFLKPIIDDIVLLTGMALVGKTADSILLQIPIRRVRTARAQAEGKASDPLGTEIRTALAEQFKALGGNSK